MSRYPSRIVTWHLSIMIILHHEVLSDLLCRETQMLPIDVGRKQASELQFCRWIQQARMCQPGSIMGVLAGTPGAFGSWNVFTGKMTFGAVTRLMMTGLLVTMLSPLGKNFSLMKDSNKVLLPALCSTSQTNDCKLVKSTLRRFRGLRFTNHLAADHDDLRQLRQCVLYIGLVFRQRLQCSLHLTSDLQQAIHSCKLMF